VAGHRIGETDAIHPDVDRTLQIRWLDAHPPNRHACGGGVVIEAHSGAGYSSRRDIR